jgi:chromosome segregation ATPase
MTEQEITEMRSRIAELEERDADFARKSNLLLDEILLTRDQVEENTRAIAESRRDIDQLAQRTGELAQSISELRQNQQLLTFTVGQLAESMAVLRQVQQTTTDSFVETFVRFQETASLDRQSFQTEILRIWEYLTTTRPNGRGEQGGGG